MTPGPWALALAGLSIPLVIAYLHRRRREDMAVPSLLLFRDLAGPPRPTRPAWARPRHLLSLLLLLAALSAVVSALGGLGQSEEPPRTIVAVLDASASMGARDDGDTTRLDAAREALDELTTGLRPRDRIALVVANRRARVAVAPTEDHPRVPLAAASLQPRGGAQAVRRALAVADAICSGAQGPAQVVLLSDGAQIGAPKMKCPLHHARVGVAADNVGITGLSVREVDALGLTEVLLELTATGDHPAEVEVDLEVDGVRVDRVPIEVPKSGRGTSIASVPLPDGERIRATIRPWSDGGTDVLAADDTATAARRAAGTARLLLVTDATAGFTAEALRLHPRAEVTVTESRGPLPAGDFDAVILETAPGFPLPTDVKVVAMGVDPGAVGLTGAGRTETPEIVRWDFDAPLFRYVDLGTVTVQRSWLVRPSNPEDSVVDTPAGSIGQSASWDGRPLLYLGFSPADSDLGLRVGFVNLMANVVEWAAPEADANANSNSGGDVVDAAESRLTPADVVGAQPGLPTQAIVAGIDPWRALVAAAVVALMLEWLLPVFARRRKRRSA